MDHAVSPAPSTATRATESVFDLSLEDNSLAPGEIRSLQNLKLNDSSPEFDKNRKEIVKSTKSISAVAARKRTSQKHFDRGGRPPKMNLHEKTAMSLRSVHEASEPEMDSEYLSQSRLARHNRGHTVSTPFLNSSSSDLEDNISITTTEKKVDTRGQYKGGIRRIGDKPMLDKRRRRTMSYDQVIG